jgi:hypothetical protein
MAGLGDFLAGVGGAPVNRPGLEAFVANSQATNGLRTAQTEEALLNAQNTRDELDAKSRVEGSLGDFLASQNDPHAKEHATLVSNLMRSKFDSFKGSEAGLGDALKNINTQTLMDPNADPAKRAAADQANNPNTSPYMPDQGQLVSRFPQGANPNAPPTVFQTPGSQSTQHAQDALGNLHQTQSDVGGFNPHQAGMPNLPPEQIAAINQAQAEGRLNFRDVNSRNAALVGQMALNHPTYNFNEEAADASLSRNPTFQQRAKVVDAMPGLISNVASLGKKLNYPDLEIAGRVKQAFMGQTNDPDLVAYSSARNDLLLKLANVMRGVGMSDKSVEMEHEAWKPTLSPPALDAWVKAQMSVLTPLMEQQKHGAHIGAPGTSYEQPAGGAAAATPGAGAALSLDEYLKKQGF